MLSASLCALLFLGNSTSPASSDGTEALSLQWKEFDTQDPWSSISGPSADFFELRIQGEASTFAGTWVEIACRVRFGRSFVAPAQASSVQAPYVPWDSFANVLGASPPWDLSTEGYNVPAGVHVPACILKREQYAFILAKNGGETPGSQAVARFSEPMLGVPFGQPETTRVWDLQYPHWPSMTKEYWGEVNGLANYSTMISRDAIIKRLVLDQLPHLTPDFFTSDTWEMALGSGILFQIQGVTMVGGNIDPNTYPENDDDPTPGLSGSWTATGTTAELPWVYLGYQNPRLPYPSWIPSPFPDNVPANAGASITIEMSGLRKNVFARFRINEDDNNVVSLLLGAGQTVKEAVFAVPSFLAVGDTLELLGFEREGIMSALSPYHNVSFVIVAP